MKILICSDGTAPSESAIRLGGLLAGSLRAEATLVGITENPADEHSLRDALEGQSQSLHAENVFPEVVVRAGEPVRQILKQTSTTTYNLVVIGSRKREATGRYWRSRRTYEVIKAIQPAVLVAIGDCKRLKRFLVCTGGKEFIGQAVQLTGKLAAAVEASVTLLHVMAELRVRHGIVIDQVFEEVREGDYDLIVTGTSQARGLLRHYIMGDLTRSILNRANVPVLVARAGPPKPVQTLWRAVRGVFG